MFTEEELANEQWLPIECAPQYEVSNLGRIRSFKQKSRQGWIMATQDVNSKDKRQKISLRVDGQPKYAFVHRLVLLNFQPIENSEEMQVNHKDGDVLNNRLSNLEWVTEKENHQHYKDVIVPKRKEEGILNQGGRKKMIFALWFSDGTVNYYAGYEEMARQTQISKTTLDRWLREGIGNVIDKRIAGIEVVNEIPEGHENKPFVMEKPFGVVCVEYWRKPTEYYEDCRKADEALGLKKGTVNRWTRRNWNKVSNGQATQLGIKQIYYTTDCKND